MTGFSSLTFLPSFVDFSNILHTEHPGQTHQIRVSA
jgi:hypothetical protein